MHPVVAELVACVAGRITPHQEIDGEERTAVLTAGQAIAGLGRYVLIVVGRTRRWAIGRQIGVARVVRRIATP